MDMDLTNKLRIRSKMEKKRKGMDREIEWPWERNLNPASITSDNSMYCLKYGFPSRCYENKYLDIFTKRAAIKASASVVSLVTYSDDIEMFQGTGTIIEEVGTILTSVKLVTCPPSENVVAKNLKVIVYLQDGKSYEAQLLAHDFYYGIAVVKIQENVPHLKPACLRLIDDRITVDPSELHIDTDNGFKVHPGDKVIAIGRYFSKPYDLMAAPGEISTKRCDKEYECKELFATTCLITETGIGGPIVNHHGEVIGVTSYYLRFTPFLPINIALKWWEHYKIYGNLRQRPWLGMELANLYTTNLLVMEKIIRKFPNNMAGVIVEDVKQGSSADTAGICPNDLIVECCGKPVWSFLELFDMMWDNSGYHVDLVVLRYSDDSRLDLTLKVVKVAE